MRACSSGRALAAGRVFALYPATAACSAPAPRRSARRSKTITGPLADASTLGRLQVGQSVVAPRAVLKQYGLVILEAEHLEDVWRCLPIPRWATDRHPDRDALAALDEFGRLHSATFLGVLLEEVDHLLSVVSGRGRAVGAAAGNREPLSMLCE